MFFACSLYRKYFMHINSSLKAVLGDRGLVTLPALQMNELKHREVRSLPK